MPTAGQKQNEPNRSPPIRARIYAALALLLIALVFALLVARTFGKAWYLLAALVAVSLTVSAIWIAITNRRWRFVALVVGLLSIGGAIASLWAANTGVVVIALAAAGVGLVGIFGSLALRRELRDATSSRWRSVPPAIHPVLIMNPKSGGGKVAQNQLERKAAERGIGTVVLNSGDDLRALAEASVNGGADVIGMAGGDGSQALVASVASSHGVGYVCIPAGTRNHLALDLGLDRNDIVGALDAFGAANETSIDLASVNGQTFVNNVSLGVYATMVASEDYREQKAKTALATLEERLGPDAAPFDLHVDGPEGRIDNPQIVQISNNPYILTSLSGFGTRPRIDTGQLGIVVAKVGGPRGLPRLVQTKNNGELKPFPGLNRWSARTVEVRSSSPVPAGIDGESALFEPPLRFACRPAALRVRLAHIPTASPAVRRSPLGASTVVGLWSLVLGRPSGLV